MPSVHLLPASPPPPPQSVRPSTWNISAPTGRIFMKFCTSVFSGKSIQFSVKPDNNNRYFIRRPIQIFDHSTKNEKCFRNLCRENQNTHFVFSNFFPENLAVYENMWRNIVERCRIEMTTWSMRIACWITKATNTIIRCIYCVYIYIYMQPKTQQFGR
jgi:hypothetical protein